MDRFIAEYQAHDDGDLMLCLANGVAYQGDMSDQVSYGAEYFDKCRGYEDKDIAVAINRGRIELVAKHFDPVAAVVDVGVGSGEFVKKRPNTFGVDVNPVAVAWLKAEKLWAQDLRAFRAFTFWDVIEHLEEPERYFQRIQPSGYLFTSIPLFKDLTKIRESKHYRPGEHLYYWTEEGFVRWMGEHGFELLELQDFEIVAGRESIYSFAFQRRP